MTIAARLLIVPGLHDSPPAHWQTWLQWLNRGSVRVQQADWLEPELDRWALRIADTLEQHDPSVPWLVAAHSFGCLALARHLLIRPDLPVAAALLVAPADPEKFGLTKLLPQRPLSTQSVMVGSETDPYMSAPDARQLALRWGSRWVNLGDAGHINADSGFGPWPYAQKWVVSCKQKMARARRAELESIDGGRWLA